MKNSINFMVLLFINYCVAQSVGNAKVHIEMKTTIFLL